MGGKRSEEWCSDAAAKLTEAAGFSSFRQMEKREFASVTLDDEDEFHQGIAARIAGDEYGATTGRPRRTGWLDLPLLRYSREVTGNVDVILTKLDVMSDCQQIKVCIAYTYEGPAFQLGDICLASGMTLATAVPNAEVLRYCKPVYQIFPGWLTDIRKAVSKKDLPKNLLDLIGFVESEAGVKARVLSVGPDREQTIIV